MFSCIKKEALIYFNLNILKEVKLFYHKPVLLKEALDHLVINKNGAYVDATLGGGGHSSAILKILGEKGKLICLDQDIEALNYSKYLKDDSRVNIIQDNFVNIDVILYLLEINKVDGILMDIGLSSWQIDQPERGFSYMHDAKLDMRMNRENSLTAYEIVNNYEEEKLANIIFEYGEERFSRKISKYIIEERKRNKIETTFQLASIIRRAVKGSNLSFLKRVFQALRIEVNQELNFLKIALEKSLNLLKNRGRLAVITFHSLEDRIVKNTFKEYLEKGYQLINKKPIIATKEETNDNSRAASAKLRVIERNK